MANALPPYDAFLLVSFGGPEGPQDVLPFLENVLRGRNVPIERMHEVAEHYYHFGGVSPINGQNRQLLKAIQDDFSSHIPGLPCYWGNRNWHPLLTDTLRQMAQDGVRRAIAFVTSAFSSYSGCRQYREDLLRAQEEIAPSKIVIDKIRAFYNHPGFLFAMADRLCQCLSKLPANARPKVLFTAHSIPESMANTSAYGRQLQEACRLVAQLAGVSGWELVFQSRSGPPQQPWLEPDICDRIRVLHHHEWAPTDHLLIVPIGFVSDHMEVLYDLDTEAASVCKELGMHMTRVSTVGTHPRVLTMIRELVLERLQPGVEPLSLGVFPPNPDVCP
ncbi:MAG: ferrochelatase, partial [Planctomycetota bacterium]|nr:ferrochelatase [Planctomycetota bacterium]